jgi:hypothetical protein
MKLSVALTLLSTPQMMIPPNVMESGVFHAVSWSFDTPLHPQVMTHPNSNVMESGVYHAAPCSFDTPLHPQVMTPPNVMESGMYHETPWSSDTLLQLW